MSITEFFLPKRFATTRRIKDAVWETGLRFYSHDPETACLQIRVAMKPADGRGTITQVTLSAVDLRELRHKIDDEIGRLEFHANLRNPVEG